MSKDHADLQRSVKDYLESLGYTVLVTKHGKTSKHYRRPKSEKGILDLVAFKDPKWIEIKTENDIIKPGQQEFIIKEIGKGHECFVVRSMDDVKKVME